MFRRKQLVRDSTKDEDEILDALEIGQNIDEENKQQPILMGKTAKIFRRKYELFRIEELKLEIIKDELAQDIQKNPKQWGVQPNSKGDSQRIRNPNK